MLTHVAFRVRLTFAYNVRMLSTTKTIKRSDRSVKKKVKSPKTTEIKVRVNEINTNYSNIEFGCNKVDSYHRTCNLTISSWNVFALRAWVKKNGLEFLEHEKPIIMCLQETKCTESEVPEEIKTLDGYYKYWVASDRKGYAGVGLLTRIKPLNVFYGIENAAADTEGRCITAEFANFFLVTVYVPTAGRELINLPKRLDWNAALKKYLLKLDAMKPVILAGDMNVARTEIDLANPKGNRNNAAFTPQEREGMEDLLMSGFVDTFRYFYPDRTEAYTYWTFMGNVRAKNVGWRLDYFLVSSRLVPNICDSVIRSTVFGSDHCPITLFLHI